jgi:hypothetical protein
MDNSLFIFELLLRDNVFMTQLDNYILTLMKKNKIFIDPHNIPNIVLFLVNVLEVNITYYKIKLKLDTEEIFDLFELYRQYIVRKATDDQGKINKSIKYTNDTYINDTYTNDTYINDKYTNDTYTNDKYTNDTYTNDTYYNELNDFNNSYNMCIKLMTIHPSYLKKKRKLYCC